MSFSDFDSPEKSVKKRIVRKVIAQKKIKNDLGGLGVESTQNTIARHDSLASKYGFEVKEFSTKLEEELSKSSEEGGQCWTPETILGLIENLRVPLELLVKIIQVIKTTFK